MPEKASNVAMSSSVLSINKVLEGTRVMTVSGELCAMVKSTQAYPIAPAFRATESFPEPNLAEVDRALIETFTKSASAIVVPVRER